MWTGLTGRSLLLLGAVAAKQTADPHTLYLSALRRTLKLSPVGGNHSAEPGLLLAAAPIQPQALALVLPPRHVHTVQKCLGVVGYINDLNEDRSPNPSPQHSRRLEIRNRV